MIAAKTKNIEKYCFSFLKCFVCTNLSCLTFKVHAFEAYKMNAKPWQFYGVGKMLVYAVKW